jgi:hypothetical protein
MVWTRTTADGDKKYMHNVGEGDLTEGSHLENPEGDRIIGYTVKPRFTNLIRS